MCMGVSLQLSVSVGCTSRGHTAGRPTQGYCTLRTLLSYVMGRSNQTGSSSIAGRMSLPPSYDVCVSGPRLEGRGHSHVSQVLLHVMATTKGYRRSTPFYVQAYLVVHKSQRRPDDSMSCHTIYSCCRTAALVPLL